MSAEAIGREVSRRNNEVCLATRTPLVVEYRNLLAELALDAGRPDQINAWISGNGTAAERDTFKKFLSTATQIVNYGTTSKITIMFKDGKKRR